MFALQGVTFLNCGAEKVGGIKRYLGLINFEIKLAILRWAVCIARYLIQVEEKIETFHEQYISDIETR